LSGALLLLLWTSLSIGHDVCWCLAAAAAADKCGDGVCAESDCLKLASNGTAELCEPATGKCDLVPVKNGTLCQFYGTQQGSCQGGVCRGGRGVGGGGAHGRVVAWQQPAGNTNSPDENCWRWHLIVAAVEHVNCYFGDGCAATFSTMEMQLLRFSAHTNM
jgi:hypothetical protein